VANTGDKLVAMAAGTITEPAGGTTGSLTYVAVGAACGLAFVAPASGIVVVHFATAGFNSGANDNKTTVQVRNGNVLGAGTVFYTAVDNDMILFTGAATYRKGSFVTVGFMTAGNTYNVQMLHRTSAGTMTVLYRSVTVCPQT
jgi:hypothetical protein